MIAAAAAKPMTVLRIVLTPLLLEKPQPSGGTQQFRSCCRVRRSASEAEGRVSCGGTFCSITEHGGLYGAGAEQVPGFLAGVIAAWLRERGRGSRLLAAN